MPIPGHLGNLPETAVFLPELLQVERLDRFLEMMAGVETAVLTPSC